MEERYVSCFCIELAIAVAPAKRLRFNIKNTVAGLPLRAGSRGFPTATMNVASATFSGK